MHCPPVIIAAMESWYKVHFVFSEPGVRGKAIRLQNDYSRIFVKNRGPNDALVFTDQEHNQQHYDYYFSPGAMRIRRASGAGLRAASPCSRPDRKQVTLAVGKIHSVERCASPERLSGLSSVRGLSARFVARDGVASMLQEFQN